MINKICEYCDYWHRINDTDTGACHRYPPIAHVHLLPAGGGVIGSNRQGIALKPVETMTWPRVLKDEFCGEWNG